VPSHVKVLGALALLSLFLTTRFFTISGFLEATAMLLAIVTCVEAIRYKRKSRYDLRGLRELHESGGPPPVDDLPEVAEDAGVVCPCCGTVYGAWMLICPNCKR